MLTLFETGSDVETELIDAANEIEIYNMDYDETLNRVIFDGLRFSDHKFVIGFVDLAWQTVVASISSTGRFNDLQFF